VGSADVGPNAEGAAQMTAVADHIVLRTDCRLDHRYLAIQLFADSEVAVIRYAWRGFRDC
jgi:hypothetical protein